MPWTEWLKLILVLLGVAGFFWGLVRYFVSRVDRVERAISDKLDELESGIKTEREARHMIELNLERFKAEIQREFPTKSELLRFQNDIMAQLADIRRTCVKLHSKGPGQGSGDSG